MDGNVYSTVVYKLIISGERKLSPFLFLKLNIMEENIKQRLDKLIKLGEEVNSRLDNLIKEVEEINKKN